MRRSKLEIYLDVLNVLAFKGQSGSKCKLTGVILSGSPARYLARDFAKQKSRHAIRRAGGRIVARVRYY
jgi:hypothetical protein